MSRRVDQAKAVAVVADERITPEQVEEAVAYVTEVATGTVEDIVNYLNLNDPADGLVIVAKLMERGLVVLDGESWRSLKAVAEPPEEDDPAVVAPNKGGKAGVHPSSIVVLGSFPEALRLAEQEILKLQPQVVYRASLLAERLPLRRPSDIYGIIESLACRGFIKKVGSDGSWMRPVPSSSAPCAIPREVVGKIYQPAGDQPARREGGGMIGYTKKAGASSVRGGKAFKKTGPSDRRIANCIACLPPAHGAKYPSTGLCHTAYVAWQTWRTIVKKRSGRSADPKMEVELWLEEVYGGFNKRPSRQHSASGSKQARDGKVEPKPVEPKKAGPKKAGDGRSTASKTSSSHHQASPAVSKPRRSGHLEGEGASPGRRSRSGNNARVARPHRGAACRRDGARQTAPRE